MNTVSVIILVILFCIAQIVLMKKVSKKWVKYLPTAIGGAGVVIGFAIYYRNAVTKRIVGKSVFCFDDMYSVYALFGRWPAWNSDGKVFR